MTLRERVLAEVDPRKTDKMRLIEERRGFTIQELIRPRQGVSGDQIARALGINKGTLSRWRHKFQIETRKLS